MSEQRKRLQPTIETLRELYLKSGNECAFPNCKNRMIDSNGNFIGQICHIEAAEQGGERFNPTQSNENCRQFENLMLMCYEHHTVTDDIAKYSVQRMKQIKADHEAIYSHIVERIQTSIIDYTTHSNLKTAHNLTKLYEIMEWEIDEDNIIETTKEINELASRLHRVPRKTRELLAVIVDRGEPLRYYKEGITAPCDDIAEACEISPQELRKHVNILTKHEFASMDKDELNGIWYIEVTGDPSWFWEMLQEFCKKTETSIKEFIVDGYFDCFDE